MLTRAHLALRIGLRPPWGSQDTGHQTAGEVPEGGERRLLSWKTYVTPQGEKVGNVTLHLNMQPLGR